ncbi:Major facilitator superfamily [Mactra antiquata]
MSARSRVTPTNNGMVTTENGENTLIEQHPLYDEEDDPLPVWRKICFAIGGAPYQTTNTVINFFISIFLLEVAKISPGYSSIILFVGKAWDAITDPTCGYLVHKMDSRLGKFKPWILFSAPFACGAYFCLWYVPDISDLGKFFWYFCFYCGFQMLLSGLHVPYTSMTMAVTNSQKDRDSVTAYRMVSEALGVLLAVVVEGQLVGKYRKTGDCSDKGTISDEDLKNEKRAYMIGAAVVVAVYLFCACTVFFGSKEKHGYNTGDADGFFSGAKQVLTFRPYIILCTAFLFLSLAIAIVQGNLALFCTHSLKMGDQFSFFILVLLISTILAMPLWQLCIVKYGKKSTFGAGMMLLVPVLIVQLYLPKHEPVYFYPVLVVAGLSIAVALLLPWSMLPDVIDEFFLKYGTRKESIFYSFYVFFNKLSIGVGLGISQAVLALGGYKTGECEQPASVGLSLQMLVVPGPVLFTMIALVALWIYPINEYRRRKIKEAVKEKLKKIEQSNDPSNVNPNNMYDRDYIPSVSYKSITESDQM